MREQLHPGEIITLLNETFPKEYLIKHVIGEGASCIVYDAQSKNGLYSYRIKECYPINAHIHRVGQELIWQNETEKNRSFSCLTNAHNLLTQLRNTESIGNNITNAELCEGNGTLYSVMEVNYAQTYDKIKESDLHSILMTMRVLTDVVGTLHEQGYLHLDIKPENFLVNHKPNTTVWLFDVDSLLSKEELLTGTAKYISYSQGYAAPEQKQGRFSKLCPATDVFAIGSILFEKIMGRAVTAADMGYFSDWQFEGKLFESVNPKIKRVLKDIFRKTLASSINRRFQSAEELSSVLREACTITALGTPYISSKYPTLTTDIIGRQDELRTIHEELCQGKKVFLHGFGGIGKSSVAIAYANQYCTEYDSISFLRYNSSLETLLDDIQIQNFEGETKERKKMLNNLLNDKTLLIVDNFDIAIDEDEYLDDFLAFNAHILFTSRTDFSSVYSGKISQVEIKSLPRPQLMELFCRSAKISTIDADDLEMVGKLLSLVEYHTYAAEMLGRQLAVSGCSITYLFNELSEGLSNLGHFEAIRSHKDGRVRKGTILDIMRILFDMSLLTEKQKAVLRNICLLGTFVRLDKDSYRKYVSCSFSETEEYDEYEEQYYYTFTTESQNALADINALNDLEELGWVKTQQEWLHKLPRYQLHPLVEEMVITDLTPSEDNCPEIFGYIKKTMRSTLHPFQRDDVDEMIFDKRCEFLCRYFIRSSFQVDANFSLALEWLSGMYYNASPQWYPFAELYQKLEKIADIGKIDKQLIFQIRCIIISGWLYEYRSISPKELLEEREKQLYKSLSNAKLSITKLSNTKQKEALQTLYSLINNSINDSFCSLPKSFVHEMVAESQGIIQLSTKAKKDYHIPLSADELEAEEKQREKWAADADWQQFHKDSEEKHRVVENFRTEKDKLAFIQKLVADNTIPPINRVKWIAACRQWIFDYLFNHYIRHTMPSEEISWNLLSDILDQEEDWLLNDSWKPVDYNEWFSWDYHLAKNLIAFIVTYAVLKEYDSFDACLEILESDLSREAKKHLSCGYHWANILRYDRVGDMELLYEAVEVLCRIGKSSLIMPLLLKVIEHSEQYARQHDDFEDKGLFPFYKAAVECAKGADCEYDIPEKYKLDYWDIQEKYEEKIKSITGIDHDFIWK